MKVIPLISTIFLVDLISVIFACNDDLKNNVIEELTTHLQGLKAKEILHQCCVESLKIYGAKFERAFHTCFYDKIQSHEDPEFFMKLHEADFNIKSEGVNVTCYEDFPKDYGLINFKPHECKPLVKDFKECLNNICMDVKEANKDDECTMKVLNVACDFLAEKL